MKKRRYCIIVAMSGKLVLLIRLDDLEMMLASNSSKLRNLHSASTIQLSTLSVRLIERAVEFTKQCFPVKAGIAHLEARHVLHAADAQPM